MITPEIQFRERIMLFLDEIKNQWWESALFFDVPEVEIKTCNTARENYNFSRE